MTNEPTRLINLTPHDVTLIRSDGSSFTLAPSGQVARVAATLTPMGEDIEGIPVYIRALADEVEGLPIPFLGIKWVVSSMVLEAARRPDLLAPDTGSTALRRNGLVVGVRQLIAFDCCL